jgi:hypothetical protein
MRGITVAIYGVVLFLIAAIASPALSTGGSSLPLSVFRRTVPLAVTASRLRNSLKHLAKEARQLRHRGRSSILRKGTAAMKRPSGGSINPAATANPTPPK